MQYLVIKKYYFSESQNDEQVKVGDDSLVYIEDKSTKSILSSLSNSSVKHAPLFCVHSVPDEQIPGLNHLVNRPQSWIPQLRSKRLTQGIHIFLFHYLIVNTNITYIFTNTYIIEI